MIRRYIVYRLVDKQGNLLYIGSTFASLKQKLRYHKAGSGFGLSIGGIEVVEEFPTYLEMIDAEVEYIKKLRPPKNVASWQTRSRREPSPQELSRKRKAVAVPPPAKPTGPQIRSGRPVKPKPSPLLERVAAAQARHRAMRKD